jgi:hypothetical protein
MTRAATSTTGVRRNLFQGHLTRRPTPTTGTGEGGTTAATATSSSSTSAETLRLDIDVLSDSSEIVIRDKNGEFEVGDPPTPPLDDHDDEAALDDVQENARMHFAPPFPVGRHGRFKDGAYHFINIQGKGRN